MAMMWQHVIDISVMKVMAPALPFPVDSPLTSILHNPSRQSCMTLYTLGAY